MESHSSEGGLLLVVHSSATDRDKLSLHLQEAGYSTLVAPDGQEGLALARREGIELLLLEVHGPSMDGAQLVSTLKADRTLADLPVILLAPLGEVKAVERGMDAGAEDYLFAPYSPTLLKAQVAHCLSIGRKRREEQQRHERESLLKIERDVQIARDIQLGFLPKDLPQPEGWEVAACFYPAREVAGDFYDVFTLSQGRRLALVISDICDKGVGSALFMALFRSLIRAYSQQHYSMRWTDVLDEGFTLERGGRQRLAPSTGSTALKNAMDLTNDYMIRNHVETNYFATTFFGVLDPATGELMYVNGGHNPPAIISMVDGQPTVKARLKPTGPALGMLPDTDYRIEQVVMEPGDILYTFTDGVTDAKNAEGGRFGEQRMLPLLLQPCDSAKALLDRMDLALSSFIGETPQFDDITMLAVRRSFKP